VAELSDNQAMHRNYTQKDKCVCSAEKWWRKCCQGSRSHTHV